jgi:hypothetical protein
MGEINKTTLGRLSGLIGDVVFRQRDGANYVSSRPGNYPVTTNPIIIAKRERFKLVAGFAGAINSIGYLRSIWKPYTPERCSPFNLMIHTNYPLINNGVISDRAMLVPDWGFAVNTTTLSFDASGVSAVFEALGNATGIDEVVETNIYLAAVVHLSNPVENTDKPDEFFSLLSASQPVDLANPLTFSIPLDSMESKIFLAYQATKIFAALFTVDANDKPVHYSNTVSG